MQNSTINYSHHAAPPLHIYLTENLHHLIPFTHFTHPSPLATTNPVSVYMNLVFYFYLFFFSGGGLVAKLCSTNSWDPTDYACQAPLSMGFSRQEYWSGLSFPSPGDLPKPGIEPVSPALQADDIPTKQ